MIRLEDEPIGKSGFTLWLCFSKDIAALCNRDAGDCGRWYLDKCDTLYRI